MGRAFAKRTLSFFPKSARALTSALENDGARLSLLLLSLSPLPHLPVCLTNNNYDLDPESDLLNFGLVFVVA